MHDLPVAIAELWSLVDPDFDLAPTQELEIPEAQLGDFDAGLLWTYQIGDERYIQAAAQRLDETVFVFICNSSGRYGTRAWHAMPLREQ